MAVTHNHTLYHYNHRLPTNTHGMSQCGEIGDKEKSDCSQNVSLIHFKILIFKVHRPPKSKPHTHTSDVL